LGLFHEVFGRFHGNTQEPQGDAAFHHAAAVLSFTAAKQAAQQFFRTEHLLCSSPVWIGCHYKAPIRMRSGSQRQPVSSPSISVGCATTPDFSNIAPAVSREKLLLSLY
jgi:hypothetical protein